jgi:hypothetical protein
MHSCGATCTKYSFKSDGKGKRPHPCRFKAPWKLREKTEFTSDGLLHIRRDHERINRYSPALAVAMRHNTDTTFLPTNSAGLSMVYYATNYSTKLDTPLWKRAAMVKTVMETMSEQEGQQEPPAETTSEQTAQKNNKARQFLSRAANRIFTSREVSAVEVCSSLLGYKNSYSSQGSWSHVHLNTLYWAVFRRWDSLRGAAGPDIQLRAAPEVVGISLNGFTLPALEAYSHRGGLLRELCFYEYLSVVGIRRVRVRTKVQAAKYIPFESTLPDSESWTQELLTVENEAVPIFTGHLDYDVQGTEPGFHMRYIL